MTGVTVFFLRACTGYRSLDAVDGNTPFRHACAWGLKASLRSGGIGRIGPGQSPDWVKVKKPGAPGPPMTLG